MVGNPDFPWGGPSAIEGTAYHHPGFEYVPQNAGIKEFAEPTDVGIVILDSAVEDLGFGVHTRIELR